ncbi:hypothetical protein LRS06_01195 [Hymenobacter sp. J193]|uniref:hypothetical protein n=1 Tax=Hymenobacter sp. J193 TaxID=2898429 RepID=UPI002151CDDF|nr:hypothetical protein [Hymenobacter sp. J193]MCR5886409.1 hypothetical protein [Hymenobacter sp. J193]
MTRASAFSPKTPKAQSGGAGNFLRGSLGAGLAIGARTAGALLLGKLLAVYGGPGGLTLLAHFQNLMALFTTLPNDGVHVGFTKYAAPLRPGSGRYQSWLGAAVVLNLAALVAGALVLAVGQAPLVGMFRPSVAWLAGFGLGLAGLVANTLLTAALLAAGRLRAYVGLTVLLSALSVGAVALALYAQWPVENVLLTYLLAQALVVAPTALAARRVGIQLPGWGPVSRPALVALSHFLLMALSTLVFGKAVDFALRAVLVREFGLAQTDLWQAVAKLSDNYTMVFAALMSSVYYPRLAALSAQPQAQGAYVRSILLLLMPVLAAGLGLLYLVRSWLLPLLFEEQFAAAGFLLPPQLLGDWARFLTWVLLYLLVAQARVGRYVAVQAGSAVLYAGLLAVCLPRYGLLGAPIAQAVRYGVLLLTCGLYFRRTLTASVHD